MADPSFWLYSRCVTLSEEPCTYYIRECAVPSCPDTELAGKQVACLSDSELFEVKLERVSACVARQSCIQSMSEGVFSVLMSISIQNALQILKSISTPCTRSLFHKQPKELTIDIIPDQRLRSSIIDLNGRKILLRSRNLKQ